MQRSSTAFSRFPACFYYYLFCENAAGVACSLSRWCRSGFSVKFSAETRKYYSSTSAMSLTPFIVSSVSLILCRTGNRYWARKNTSIDYPTKCRPSLDVGLAIIDRSPQ